MPTQISNEPPVAPRDLRILLPLAGLIIAAFLMIAAGVIGLFPWQSTNPTPPPTPPAATTAASPLASPTPVLITLKQEVHLYNLPELGTPQKGRIPPGAQLTLLARDPGNAWVKVVTQDNENGWVQAAELPLSSEVAAQLPLGVLPVTTPLTVIPISSPAPAVTISPTQPPLTPTATAKPVVETTVELTEEATEEATAMPLDSTTEPPPPVRQPCQVEIVGPPQDAAFITADEIRLEWSSPGRLAYNQTYRVSFYRPGDRQYLNAFLTKDPFAVKAAGNTHWINPNNQEWVANVQENAAYEWEVAVLENEEQELCKSDSRIFVWNLK